MGHGPAVGLLEDFDRPIVAAQQVRQTPRRTLLAGRLLFLGLQFGDGVAEDGVIGAIAAMAACICRTSAGPKGPLTRTACFKSKSTLCTIANFSLHRLTAGIRTEIPKSQRGESNP